MPWLRLRLAANAEHAESVAERLQEAGAMAVSLLPNEPCATPALEPLPGQTPLWQAVRIEALLRPDANLNALPRLDFDVDFVADEDWAQTWQQGFAPMRFGRLLVAAKAHCGTRAGEGALLRIDPGLAFGTGAHATTALCLAWLANRALDGKRVLDVGSGSGILAIAALLLGADSAVAVDHDPQARRASRDNARQNGVPLHTVAQLDEVHDRFDIALANIVADTLCELAPALGERAETLVLSGILPAQTERVMAAFPHIEFHAPAVKDGWVLLSGRRRA